MAITGIYKITSPTNKIYIGQSHDINSRKRAYTSALCKGQPKLYESIIKYGWKNHGFEILCELSNDVDQKTLDDKEIEFWQYYSSMGCNMLNTRHPGSGGKISEETKQKMRKPKPSGFGEKIAKVQSGTKRPQMALQRLGDKNPHAKETLAFDSDGKFIGSFSTQMEAGNFFKFKNTVGISDCCRGLRKTHFGFIFRYA